jgi:hypothetical protein
MKSNSSTSWSILIVLCLTLALSINASAQTTKLKSLCEKYVVDCPISISQSSNWLDIAIVQELLRDYLIERKTKVEKTYGEKNYINSVYFDGDKIDVVVMVNDGLSDEENERKYSNQISLLLQDAFMSRKQIVIYIAHKGPASVARITSEDLKDKYLRNGDLIDYSALWAGIINAVDQVKGFEIDPKTEDRKQNRGEISTKISTHATISEKDGFVNKYFLTVEMGLYRESEVWIETLLHLWRRRASSNNWSEIQVGDGIHSLGGTSGNSSAPVLDKIKEALRR